MFNLAPCEQFVEIFWASHEFSFEDVDTVWSLNCLRIPSFNDTPVDLRVTLVKVVIWGSWFNQLTFFDGEAKHQPVRS